MTDSGNKVGEFAIADSVEILAGDVRSEFSDITVGSTVIITYDRTRQMLTRVEIESNGMQLVPISEISGKEHPADPWITKDGLTLYWSNEGEIWRASRKDSTSPFGNKTKLFQGRHPTVSADGKIIVFLGRPAGGRGEEVLYSTTLPGHEEPVNPKPIKELITQPSPKSPCLVGDGNTLYFNCVGKDGAIFVVSRRPTTRSAWSMPEALPLKTTHRLGELTWIYVFDDECTFLCTHQGSERARGSLMLWHRGSPNELFSKSCYLDLHGVPPLHGRSARYCSETNELFFARNTGDNQFDLAIVKNLVLDPTKMITDR